MPLFPVCDSSAYRLSATLKITKNDLFAYQRVRETLFLFRPAITTTSRSISIKILINMASNLATVPPLAPVRTNGQSMEPSKLTRSNLGRACMWFPPSDYSRGHLQIAKSGIRLSKPFSHVDIRRPSTCSTQMQSTSVIFQAASNARNAAATAEQIQTVTRKAPTITNIPGKEKSPKLYDGGSGFPPYHDGGSGGGGGGGGDKPSGGWILFALLGVLGFLKDKEIEWRNRRDGR